MRRQVLAGHEKTLPNNPSYLFKIGWVLARTCRTGNDQVETGGISSGRPAVILEAGSRGISGFGSPPSSFHLWPLPLTERAQSRYEEPSL